MDNNVAVIVPILNESTSLPELLKSLQTLQVNEVVVVDGGSTDGSQTILEKSRCTWVASAPGRAHQMNQGADICVSDILVFLHADTELTSKHVDDVCAVMSSSSTVAGRFDVSIKGEHPLLPIIAFFINLRSRWSRISTGDQAMFVRRNLFERLGGFPEQPLMEDVEFSMWLKRAGDIACLRRKVVTSGRRWQRHGVFQTVWLMWKLRFCYWLGANPAELKKQYENHE
ncbi:MAG: TIGR04283 family arsenosugar biosynthesis glycosyltransferase [Mariprofundaceae bacterium]